MAAEYSKKTNAELVEILKSRSLPHTGKKADLVARLQEADKADAEKAAAAAPTTATTTEPTTTETTTKVDAEDVIDWDDDDTPTVEPVTSKTTTTTADSTVKADATDAKTDTTTTEAAITTEAPAVAPEPTPAEAPAKQTDKKAEVTTEATKEGGNDSAAKAEEKPATDYTMGLSTTDFEAELAKRKARAEKFGIVEDAATASEEAKKSLERAKRFGTEGGSAVGVKGLDEALSSDRPRKRGRGGDDEDGGRGGKRTDFGGRGRGRWGRRGHRNQGGNGGRRSGNQRNDNRPANGDNKSSGKAAWSEQDIAAMEKRKARFATAA